KATLPNTQLYTLIVRNSRGCADSAQVLLKVKPRTIADFTVLNLKPYFADTVLHFHNLSQNATSYLWDFGDNTTSNAPEPDHVFLNTGTYKIMLVAYNTMGCKNDTSIIYINVMSSIVKIFI